MNNFKGGGTNLTIIDKFFENGSKYPNRMALSNEEKRLTYKQLNEHSNYIALQLLKKGVKKGDFVGVFLTRSIEAVIGFLGILKVGAVYVPIDPAYPAERIEYMIADTACSVIITNSKTMKQLPKLNNNPAIIYSDKLEYIEEDVRCEELGQEDIAYVIYTSGSTGTPKGTMIKHIGAVNLAEWLAKHYQFHPQTVISEFASFSFDASIIDLVQSLLNGVHLHLLSEKARLDYQVLLEEINEYKITNMILPTAFFNSMVPLLRAGDKEKLSSLEVLALAGEALTGEMVRMWQEKFGLSPMLSNFYGPTETTVMASYYDLDFYLSKEIANVPIGSPIQNVKLYVVNENGKLCLPNEPGELVIEGPGVSLGYLNQLEKTMEVFLKESEAKPFTFYRTGDIVKLLPEGIIEFLGRKDDQVKIRGHRVEIGEIENFIQGLDYIHEVAVVARASGGMKELYGFYRLKENVNISKQWLESEMKKTLPEYMIPSYLIELAEMPIAPTGKIDRKKLEKIDIQSFFAQDIIGPRNQIETILVNELGKVLLLEKFDVREDFFTIGASSLKILNALAKLKPHFPMLSLQDFYTYRTVEKLAEYIATADRPTQKQKMNTVKSLKEYPPTIAPKKANASNKREQKEKLIFLTGATGFLGTHILLDLLRETDAKIVCLVRGKSEVEAKARLLDNIAYFSRHEIDDARIDIILGDLAMDGLGLSQEVQDHFEKSLDWIIHCAADVRHFGDEEHFHNVNVKGTERLLDLAYRNQQIKLSYISTIGIPEQLAVDGLWEDYCGVASPAAFTVELDNVYTDSKFAAEKLVHKAMEAGINANVFRIGNLTGCLQSGKFQKNIESNAFYRMMKGLLLLEKGERLSGIVDLTPADVASRTIVEIALNKESCGKTFHIVDPNPLQYQEFIQQLESLGYIIAQVSREEFSTWVFANELAQESKQLAVSMMEGEGLKETPWKWDCTQTRQFIPYYDSYFIDRDQYIKSMIRHGQEVGYFPLPNPVHV